MGTPSSGRLRVLATLTDYEAVHALLELLYGVGPHASEAVAVRVADLRLGEAELLVRRAKRGESRVQPLPPAARPTSWRIWRPVGSWVEVARRRAAWAWGKRISAGAVAVLEFVH